LDWLAVEFMDPSDGSSPPWDLKRMVKLMVMSATYRQASRTMPASQVRDPDNRLLSRGPSKRLEAEFVRDQALALSGLLSPKIHGPSVFPPQPDGLWQAAFNGERTYPTSTGEDRYRRGIYTFWRRTVPYPSMAAFDAPSREVCTIRRIQTSTPLQAFVTLNDPVYVECAQALARRTRATRQRRRSLRCRRIDSLCERASQYGRCADQAIDGRRSGVCQCSFRKDTRSSSPGGIFCADATRGWER
jgi:hypothetical protein